MKKLIIILLAAVFLAACAEGGYIEPATTGDFYTPEIPSEDEPDESYPQEYTIGTVSVTSGGVTYEPLRNWNHGYGDGMSVSGFAMSPQHALGLVAEIPLGNVHGVLPNVIYADDFKININGDDLISILYILYKNEYEGEFEYKVVSRTDGIDDPGCVIQCLSEAAVGEYILDVSIWWGNDYAGSSFQYFFKIIKESETPQITPPDTTTEPPVSEIPEPEPPFIYPEMPRTDMLPLTAERDLQIRQNYMAYLPDWWQSMTVEDLAIINYFGAYNGHEVLVIYPREYMNTDDMQYIVIGDFVISITSGSFELVVHNDGTFLHITEAYEQGWLIDEDIALIAGQTSG